jgi:hypothetical protein
VLCQIGKTSKHQAQHIGKSQKQGNTNNGKADVTLQLGKQLGPDDREQDQMGLHPIPLGTPISGEQRGVFVGSSCFFISPKTKNERTKIKQHDQQTANININIIFNR